MEEKIVNQEIDLAGKDRVWVEIAPDELVMLKFHTNPTEAMIDDAITNLNKMKEVEKQLELDRIIQQMQELVERKIQLEDEIYLRKEI